MNSSDLPLYIGIGMIAIGLVLTVYISVKIVRENRRGRDETLD